MAGLWDRSGALVIDPVITAQSPSEPSAAGRARFVKSQLPPQGLFAGQEFRISPDPFPLEATFVDRLQKLGRLLLQFNRAANLLYRQSVAGKLPSWIAQWLDLGKPPALVELQRSPAFKNDLPRVIRPDLLLTDSGFAITELDSVPGGIGLTAWLNQTYHNLQLQPPLSSVGTPPAASPNSSIVGGPRGMLHGFEQIFGTAKNVHIIVSAESATYQPEMEWLASQLTPDRFTVRSSEFTDIQPGDAVYRFFELFDLPNIPSASHLLSLRSQKQIALTPPPKAFLEEKMLLALLWNRNLLGFWRQELGESFLNQLQELVPYTWLIDPAPLPPHGAIPQLNLTDWHQLKALSQKDRQLILKVSGFSEAAWGARGVFLGSDLSTSDWAAAVDLALSHFDRSPHILQRYDKPRTINGISWFDFDDNTLKPMPGRVRLCPYYFVVGPDDSARTELGGVLATICPADKKIIHGMRDAILAPCATIHS